MFTGLYATLVKIVIALLVLGGLVFWGYTLGEKHIQTAWSLDKAAASAKLAQSEARVIELQTAHDKAVQDAEKDHEKLVADNAAIADDFRGRVRSLESALRLRAVSGAVDRTAQPVGAGPVSGGLDGIADSVGRLNTAVDRVVAAGQHDSAELTGILSITPH